MNNDINLQYKIYILLFFSKKNLLCNLSGPQYTYYTRPVGYLPTNDPLNPSLIVV